jgi:hypothetical protein
MLKMNVGFSRKVGEENYSSRGASVNLELELESSLAANPPQLQERIRELFSLARLAVHEELRVGGSQTGQTHHHQNENGYSRSSTGRRATTSQVKAIHAIANRQRIDLPSLLDRQHQVGRPEDLTLQEASRLIDSLKGEATRNGGGG